MANKRGEELQALRGDLKEANEGRQKARVEAAGLRLEVEALRRTMDDVQRRLGVAEAHVRSLTSPLSATYTAPQVGVQSCTCGSLVANWKCEVGAHLGLSCALRCLCACLLCVLHAR